MRRSNIHRVVLATTKASKRRRTDSSSESCSDVDDLIRSSEEELNNIDQEEVIEMGHDEIKTETNEEFDIKEPNLAVIANEQIMLRLQDEMEGINRTNATLREELTAKTNSEKQGEKKIKK